MDDVNCRFDVKDTDSEIPGRLPYAALVRAILVRVGPEVTGTFNVCSLRYHLKLEEGKVVGIYPKISHRKASEGYYDDDYTLGMHRLGGTLFLGSIEDKNLFEALLEGWFKFVVLGLKRGEGGITKARKDLREFAVKTGRHETVASLGSNPPQPARFEMINKALMTLVPDDILKLSNKLSIKVDTYTDRTLCGWHKDGNDEHALILGLLNVSDGAIASTEMYFDPDTNANIELDEIALNHLRPASVRRKAMLERIRARKGVASKELVYRQFDKQPVGEIRWFNDAVWIHRTPPLKHKFDETDKGTVGIGDCRFAVPNEVRRRADVRDRYVTGVDEFVPPKRSLVRITVRDIYEPRPGVWFGPDDGQGGRRMFLRSPSAEPVKWAYCRGAHFLDFNTEPYQSSTAAPAWCVQTCDAAYFLSMKGQRVTFAYSHSDGLTWELVPEIEMP